MKIRELKQQGLMGNIINQCISRVAKDVKNSIVKEVSLGLLVIPDDYSNIIND